MRRMRRLLILGVSQKKLKQGKHLVIHMLFTIRAFFAVLVDVNFYLSRSIVGVFTVQTPLSRS